MRKPLYRYPLRQAAANDEVKAWRESHRENIRCRDAMDISIRHHFDGMHLDDCAEELCGDYVGIAEDSELNELLGLNGQGMGGME